MSGFRTRSVLKRKHISCCHRNKVTYKIGFAFGPDFDNLSLLDTPDTIWLCRDRRGQGDPKQASVQYTTQSRATLSLGMISLSLSCPHLLLLPLSLLTYLWNSISCLKILVPHYLYYKALPYYPPPSRRGNHPFLGYFWIFKLHIHLLDAVIHLHAVSIEENSLRTGSKSSWYSQYHLLAMCLKQRCCF